MISSGPNADGGWCDAVVEETKRTPGAIEIKVTYTQYGNSEWVGVERVLGSGALASRTGAVSAVACYGNVPQNPWPFKIAGRPAAAAAGMPSRRRDCHFTDTPSPSALKHLLKRGGGGGAAE